MALGRAESLSRVAGCESTIGSGPLRCNTLMLKSIFCFHAMIRLFPVREWSPTRYEAIVTGGESLASRMASRFENEVHVCRIGTRVANQPLCRGLNPAYVGDLHWQPLSLVRLCQAHHRNLAGITCTLPGTFGGSHCGAGARSRPGVMRALQESDDVCRIRTDDLVCRIVPLGRE